MTRKHRIWFPGAMYHITARGNRRSSLFNQRDDYLTYLGILEDVRSMYPFQLHAYCLMTNHIHLQIETTNFHIKLIMKEMHSRYAIYFIRNIIMMVMFFKVDMEQSLLKPISIFLKSVAIFIGIPLKLRW
jgi:putative transposase